MGVEAIPGDGNLGLGRRADEGETRCPKAENRWAAPPPRASEGKDGGKLLACEIGAGPPIALFLRFA